MTDKIIVPPIKIQGIKTKLVPWILERLPQFTGTWIEPFMGSGVVGFNAAPEQALFCDANPHIITFYEEIRTGGVTGASVRRHLEREGKILADTPAGKESHYYRIRDRFNRDHDPHDFLFLNRACFNGLIRFGPNGFNVPFCRLPGRFGKALITKIVNQVEWCARNFGKNWRFLCRDWREALDMAKSGDFVYLDPPYIGRNDGYFTPWGEAQALDLAKVAQELPCAWALSMWESDGSGRNGHLDFWHGERHSFGHRYLIGPKEHNRPEVSEALIIGHSVGNGGKADR